MKTSIMVAAAVIAASPALACAPAPSCWLTSGTSYLRSVCQGYANQTLAQVAESLDEPEKVAAFSSACKKFGISFKK